MFGDLIQPTHLLFVLVVALLVLGPKRLPDVAKSLGKGIRDFRGAMSGLEDHTSDLVSSATVHMPTPAPAEPASTSEVAASAGDGRSRTAGRARGLAPYGCASATPAREAGR